MLASIISPHQMVLCRWLAVLIRHWGTPLPGSIPFWSLLVGRAPGGPQDGGNVTVRTIATFGTLSQNKLGRGRKAICVCLSLCLLIPLILGTPGSSILHSLGRYKSGGILPQKASGLGSVRGPSAPKGAESQHECAEESHGPSCPVCLNLFGESKTS